LEQKKRNDYNFSCFSFKFWKHDSIWSSKKQCFCTSCNFDCSMDSFGDYTVDYNPYPLDNYGISKFSTAGWLNIPYEVLEAKSIEWDCGSQMMKTLCMRVPFFQLLR
jgi:hypothetical protein